MPLDLSSLEKTVASMERAVTESTSEEFLSKLTRSQTELVRSGLIQTFEFTYEACWKLMRRWLSMNLGADRVDGLSRKELFRIAAEQRLIEDAARWFEYHAARNETVHTYNPDKAEAVAGVAQTFLADARRLLAALRSHVD